MRRLLFEIGTEELPAGVIRAAVDELWTKVTKGLQAAGLAHGNEERVATPRRLAVLADVASSTEEKTELVLGPPVRVAFDGSGAPTKATLAFASRVGREPAELERVTTDKGEYVATRVRVAARSAADCLLPVLRDALNLSFPKSMRWGNTERTFARPVRWICALLDGEVLPVAYGDVSSGRVTYGHRFAHPASIELGDAREYVDRLRQAGVVARLDERTAVLERILRESAESVGGRVRTDPELFDEVSCLVENPVPLVGSIPAEYLSLPSEVLVQEMRTHQRYFAVVDGSGALLPHFIAISNTAVQDPRVSRAGYERVLRARLADARFFYDEDRKHPLETLVPRLAQVVFHRRAGTLLQKTERLEQLSAFLAKTTGHEALIPSLTRAAHLCKADLLTSMVKEFPELQGVIGRHYAALEGQPAEIAAALEDHYRPRGAGDAPPAALLGALLGTADRIDTLCALFAAGEEPTSTTDPFGLRRACLGVITIAEAHGLRYSLEAAFTEALALLHDRSGVPGGEKRDATRSALLSFARGRMRALWAERYRTDVVEAALGAGFDDIVTTSKRVAALSKLLENPEFKVVSNVVKRAVNIVKKDGAGTPEGAPNADLCTEDAEKRLLAEVQRVRATVDDALQKDDYERAFLAIGSLETPLAAFFDQILVMADDPKIRQNRLQLMRSIASIVEPLADFSRLT